MLVSYGLIGKPVSHFAGMIVHLGGSSSRLYCRKSTSNIVDGKLKSHREACAAKTGLVTVHHASPKYISSPEPGRASFELQKRSETINPLSGRLFDS